MKFTEAQMLNDSLVTFATLRARHSGTKSLRNLAAAFWIAEDGIRNNAKALEWTRDLKKKVEQSIEARLVCKSSTQCVRTPWVYSQLS